MRAIQEELGEGDGSAEVIDDLQVFPPVIDDPVVTIGRLTATAHYSDQSTQDVTRLADWQSDDESIARVGNNLTKGAYALIAEGSTQLQASFEGFVRVVPVQARAAELRNILISPEDPVRAAGISVQFTATGIYSDLRFPDLTDDVVWRSSNTAVVSFSASIGSVLLMLLVHLTLLLSFS